MQIYCCECKTEVSARLTTGSEVYHGIKKVKELPFWICDKCKNFVGCHHKTEDKTRPLGCIATKDIKKMRISIHGLLDSLWSNSAERRKLYGLLSKKIGRPYHTADIRSIAEADAIYSELYTMRFANNG